MTPDFCYNIAKRSGKKLFGVESGTECFIGDVLVSNKTMTGCTTPCSGKLQDVSSSAVLTVSSLQVTRIAFAEALTGFLCSLSLRRHRRRSLNPSEGNDSSRFNDDDAASAAKLSTGTCVETI